MSLSDQLKRIPLRWKMLLSFSVVLISLIVSMLLYVNYQAIRFVNDRNAIDLKEGRTRIETSIGDQVNVLRLTAQSVASMPQLKALLSTDLPTIKDFLLSYQAQNHGPDRFIVLDPHGRLLADTDSSGSDPYADLSATLLEPALAGQPASGFLMTEDKFYLASAAPAEAAGTVFGFVLACSRVDDSFVRSLAGAAKNEVVLLADGVLQSTLPQARLPWRSRAEWIAQRGDDPELRSVKVGGESYAALPAVLNYPHAPAVILLQSDDQALAPYRRIQFGLALLGLLAATVAIVGSFILSRRLTAPIAELVVGTRQIAAGNFDFRLPVRSGDEIGRLAEAFNNMTEGLRQRADMQKFVSQSTMEMIQTSGSRGAPTGERKRLTIFFSDIRGFTALSEHQAPERVVDILNQILSLQTEPVKRFSGDIDKFVGDAVVALFDGEDMVLNAIRCGIEIHRALEVYNAGRPTEPPIRLGIGINTGEVVLGSIGSEARRDFTAIGSHVNLCARLCSLAGPGEILIGESTYLEVRDFVAAERLAPQHVKGFTDPVHVYRITPNSDRDLLVA